MTKLQSSSNTISNYLKRVELLVGNTTLFPIKQVYNKPGVEIFAKLEWQQIGKSVKARPAFNIIKTAITNKLLTAKHRLLDATSGNTGIAYAAIGAAIGIPVTLVLPENASEERKAILKSFGAELIYTSKFDGTDGAQLKAKELFEAHPDYYFYADQYANEANWQAHYHGTAKEIWKQSRGNVTHFIAGLGTSGTFVGTTKKLKEKNPNIKAIALHPNNPMHGLEGWKHMETAIVPKIYDTTIADENWEVDTLQAFDLLKQVALKEQLLISPSAAANLLGAIRLADSIDEGVIVTTFADNADKYQELLKEIF